MPKTPEGQKHLKWCASRALLEYDTNGPREAFKSVMGDIPKSPATTHLDFMQVRNVIMAALPSGREAFERAIMSFDV